MTCSLLIQGCVSIGCGILLGAFAFVTFVAWDYASRMTRKEPEDHYDGRSPDA
jgi:hypothetical protein